MWAFYHNHNYKIIGTEIIIIIIIIIHDNNYNYTELYTLLEKLSFIVQQAWHI